MEGIYKLQAIDDWRKQQLSSRMALLKVCLLG